MIGAIPLVPHTSSWCGQGQLFKNLIIASQKITSLALTHTCMTSLHN